MQRQIALLRRLGAPEELVVSFTEVCQINESLPEDQRATYAVLLEEQCRRFGFDEILEDGWFFRPASLSGDHRRSDTAPGPYDPEAATVEQAYRRGFSQGFAECALIAKAAGSAALLARQKEIDAWRFRRIQEYASRPGAEENPGPGLFVGRRSVSVRLRWEILKRDGYRCVVCGQDAAHGVSLEIDHVVPVSKGGTDDEANLQTLCAPCNRGKSNRP
jgi:HNH endonuclease